MFFIWTSEGGPLQYAGLVLFLLQMLPRMHPELTTLGILAMVLPSVVVLATVHAWQSGSLGNVQRNIVDARNQLRTLVEDRTGITLSSFGIAMLVGCTAGIIVSIMMSLDASAIGFLTQMIAIGTVLYSHFNNPIDQQRRAERNRRANRMEELAVLVQGMPMEDFIPEDSVCDVCTVTDLKDMLRIRGVTDEELKTFVDRQNLLESLKKRRKFSDTCCICFEPYQPGEPLRVLPNCGHELHVECLDKWAFTFASSLKQQQEPSCPLCKIALQKQ